MIYLLYKTSWEQRNYFLFLWGGGSVQVFHNFNVSPLNFKQMDVDRTFMEGVSFVPVMLFQGYVLWFLDNVTD